MVSGNSRGTIGSSTIYSDESSKAGFGAVGADAIAMTLLAAELAIGPGRLSPVPAVVAAAASLARLMAARRAACRCLAIRASLT